MRKKWWLAAAIVFALILVSIGSLALVLLIPSNSRSEFNRIEEGMTLQEVKAILGEPTQRAVGPVAGHQIISWEYEDGFAGAIILFDEQGKVLQRHWRDHTFLGRMSHHFGQ